MNFSRASRSFLIVFTSICPCGRVAMRFSAFFICFSSLVCRNFLVASCWSSFFWLSSMPFCSSLIARWPFSFNASQVCRSLLHRSACSRFSMTRCRAWARSSMICRYSGESVSACSFWSLMRCSIVSIRLSYSINSDSQSSRFESVGASTNCNSRSSYRTKNSKKGKEKKNWLCRIDRIWFWFRWSLFRANELFVDVVEFVVESMRVSLWILASIVRYFDILFLHDWRILNKE